MPSSIAVQSSLPSSHAARRALRGLENTTPSPFSPIKLKVRTLKRVVPVEKSTSYLDMAHAFTEAVVRHRWSVLRTAAGLYE